MKTLKPFLRWLGWVALTLLALELFFVARIATMTVLDPQSTTFERSEVWRLMNQKGSLHWQQQWLAYPQISDALKRAVIASEDDSFNNHDGVDWAAMEKAWQKNAKTEAKAKAAMSQLAKRPKAVARPAKIVGGSTITQQLAKNLFLSAERTLLRKGQELALTLLLETFLSKQRILEIYLNNVEWGDSIFGAEAAAQHYFHKPAARLSTYEAARLAVMLPRPKYFQKLPNSGYLAERAGVIAARLSSAELP